MAERTRQDLDPLSGETMTAHRSPERCRVLVRIITIATTAVTWPCAVRAQTAGAEAEVLFREGRDLMAAGKLAEACSAFDESQKLDPAVTTLLNLAACREKLDQLATAWGLFLDAARQTRSAGTFADQQLHDVAQARAQKLEPRVSRLTINVSVQSQFDGLEIARGSERVNAGLWNRALPVDGGTYTITARAPGANQWFTQVTIAAENDVKTVEIPDLRNLSRDLDKPRAVDKPRAIDRPVAPLPRAAVAPPAVAAAIGRAAEPPRTASTPAPLVVGVAVLALLGGGLGLERWAESNYTAARSEMTSQTRRESLYNSANTKRYVAEASAASGFVAGGVALWLYLRERNRERDAAMSANTRVVPIAGGLALAGAF